MERKIQRFELGSGAIEAHMIKEQDPNLTEIRTEYVEVYRPGSTGPEQMIAWFGTVESFANWISGSETTNF